MNEAQHLSRMLFHARESIEMFADVVENRTGKTDSFNRKLVAEIDAYRSKQGWSLNGFGNEEENTQS